MGTTAISIKAQPLKELSQFGAVLALTIMEASEKYMASPEYRSASQSHR